MGRAPLTKSYNGGIGPEEGGGARCARRGAAIGRVHVESSRTASVLIKNYRATTPLAHTLAAPPHFSSRPIPPAPAPSFFPESHTFLAADIASSAASGLKLNVLDSVQTGLGAAA